MMLLVPKVQSLSCSHKTVENHASELLKKEAQLERQVGHIHLTVSGTTHLLDQPSPSFPSDRDPTSQLHAVRTFKLNSQVLGKLPNHCSGPSRGPSEDPPDSTFQLYIHMYFQAAIVCWSQTLAMHQQVWRTILPRRVMKTSRTMALRSSQMLEA